MKSQLAVDEFLVARSRLWRSGWRFGHECWYETIEDDGSKQQEASFESVGTQQVLDERWQGEGSDRSSGVGNASSRGLMLLEVLVNQDWIEGDD